MHYLPKSDLARLFRAMQAANQTHQLAALVGFFTGARISQVLNVRGEDIFERDGQYVIKIRAAKRGNAITHTLHLDADSAFDMTPLIALAKVKGLSRIFGGLERSNFNKALKRYCASVGIHSDYAHSHVFRHSAAMVIYVATQRIGAVSQFLAHKAATSALVYLAENDGLYAQEAMDNLNFAEVQ